MTQLPLTGAGPSGSGYIAKVLGYSPIAYWPLNEITGSTANCLVNSAQDGTYTGVTLANASGPDGRPCPLFDGVNDFVNAFSATLQGAFDGSEISIALWAKAYNAAFWTDGNWHEGFMFRTDANNRTFFSKTNTNNQTRGYYVANGDTDIATWLSSGTLDWFHIVITGSDTDDELKYYINGAQKDATQTPVGAWAGSLHADWAIIGAGSNVPAEVWHGWLAHCAIWDSALNATQIADLAVA